jgi:predicted RNA binding protein YcfA (HicA-like mRNA interferase family)
MSRLRLTGRQLLRTLRKAGFTVIRIKGSHHFIRQPDGRATVVPLHAGETIGPGLRFIRQVYTWTHVNLEASR